MVKRSNRSLHTLAVETLAKALGLHQLGAHLTLPGEWLLGASTGPLFMQSGRSGLYLTDTESEACSLLQSPHCPPLTHTVQRAEGS